MSCSFLYVTMSLMKIVPVAVNGISYAPPAIGYDLPITVVFYCTSVCYYINMANITFMYGKITVLGELPPLLRKAVVAKGFFILKVW